MVLEGPLLTGGSRQFESLLNHGSHSLKCCSFPFSPFPSLPFPLTPAGQLFGPQPCVVLIAVFSWVLPSKMGGSWFQGKMSGSEPSSLLSNTQWCSWPEKGKGAFATGGRLAALGAPRCGDSGSVRKQVCKVHGTCQERKRMAQGGEMYVKWFLAELQQGTIRM